MSVKKRLPLAADAPGDARRHPDDGWKLAEPYPLGRLSLRVVRMFVRVLLPPPPAPRSEGTEEAIVLHLRVMLQYMPRLTAFGFVMLLHLLNWSPLWRFRGLLPLTLLSRERASLRLDEIGKSRILPIRMMMLGPKGLILSSYFDRDEVHLALDYAPRQFTQERIALRKRMIDGEPTGPEDHIHHVDGLSP